MRTALNRRRGAAIALAGCLALLSACGEKPNSGSDERPASDVADLGEKNPATGSPIKVGFITDGKTDAIDHTPMSDAAEAVANYANEYLGGINGHKVEFELCTTDGAPAAATACAVDFVKDGVVAVLAGTVGQDHGIYETLEGSETAFVINNTADPDIMGSDRAFVFNNPIGLASSQLNIALSNNVKTGAVVVIDVPSVTGPVEALTRPMYESAGLELLMIPISPAVADATAQIQQAINDGAEQLTILGSTEFDVTVIKAAKQLGFEGPMVTQIAQFPKDLVAGIPGGVEGVETIGNLSKDPNAEDRPLFNAVMDHYGVDAVGDEPEIGYQTMLGFVLAANKSADAADNVSMLKALTQMPEASILPLSGGLKLQCGAAKVAVLPGVCVSQTLHSVLGEGGTPVKTEIFD